MANERKQHCAYCGKDLGVYYSPNLNEESCGAKECEREIRYMNRQAEAEIRERAEADDYSRYR